MSNFADVLSIPDDHVGELTEFLNSRDPCDYRDYSHWFRLMVACKRAGVDRQVFIDWCLGDPDYASDGKKIGRQWDSLK